MQLLLYIYTNQYGFCQRIGGFSRKMSVFGKTARVFRKTTAVFGKTRAVFFKTRAVLSEYLCNSIVSLFLLTSATPLSWPQAAGCDLRCDLRCDSGVTSGATNLQKITTDYQQVKCWV